MTGLVIGGGVLAAVTVALVVAFAATRNDSSSSEPSSGDRAAGAIPPRSSTSDVQAGLDFGRSLVELAKGVYDGERARDAASRQAREQSGGSVPPPREGARS